jgi:hypothetical protein
VRTNFGGEEPRSCLDASADRPRAVHSAGPRPSYDRRRGSRFRSSRKSRETTQTRSPLRKSGSSHTRDIRSHACGVRNAISLQLAEIADADRVCAPHKARPMMLWSGAPYDYSRSADGLVITAGASPLDTGKETRFDRHGRAGDRSRGPQTARRADVCAVPARPRPPAPPARPDRIALPHRCRATT